MVDEAVAFAMKAHEGPSGKEPEFLISSIRWRRQ